jgi:Tfp pilus assembly protein PilF
MRNFCRNHFSRPGRVIPLVILAFSGCGPSRSEVKKQQEQAQYHYDLAYGYFFDEKNQRGESALIEIVKSLEAKEDSADAHLLAGLIFAGRRNYLEAERHYKRSLELESEPMESAFYARNNLAAVYLATERYDDAIRELSRLVGATLYNRKGHAYNNLGWAWYKKGNLSKARQNFLTAIEQAGKLCPPRNNLGLVYLESDKLEQAERHLRRALERCPTYAEPAYHLGRIQVRRGDSRAARESFQRCLKYAGESPLADQCAARLRPLMSVTQRREAR